MHRQSAGSLIPGFALAFLGFIPVSSASPGDWNVSTHIFTDSDQWDAGFGDAFDRSGELVAIGAPGTNRAPLVGGAVYLHRRGALDWWPRETTLAPPQLRFGDQFGRAVALDGDTLAVGAPGDDEKGSDAGAVWIFRRVDDSWVVEGRVVPGDARAGLQFGRRFALEGDNLAVGEPDSNVVYVFRRESSGWRQEARLTGDVQSYYFGGGGLRLRGDLLAVGAPYEAPYGAVYLFERQAGTWVRTHRLAQPGGMAGNFGWSIAFGNDFMAVGSPSYGAGYYDRPGAVFVYRDRTGGWSLDRMIPNPSSSSWYGRSFGTTVAAAADVLAIVAYDVYINGYPKNAAYVYRDLETSFAAPVLMTSPEQDSIGTAADVDSGAVLLGPTKHFLDFYRAAVIHFEGGDDQHNRPPFARFAIPERLECTTWSGAPLTLDGSRSTDPDSTSGTNDDIVTFDWWLNPEAATPVALGEGETREAFVPLGEFEVSLRTTDRAGYYDDVSARVQVVDWQAPTGRITAPAEDACLGLQDLPVRLEDDFRDACDANPRRLEDLARLGVIRLEDGMRDGKFGEYFALDGDVLAISAWREKRNPDDPMGAVYVFRRDGDAWRREARLVAVGAAPSPYGFNYGNTLAVSGDLLVVGAYSENGVSAFEGSVYVYRNSAGAWTFEAKLRSPVSIRGGRFGASVAIDGSRVIVGAWGSPPGWVYVFERDASGWEEVQRISVPDAPAWSGWGFGSSVGVHGDQLFVAAPGQRALSGTGPIGALHVFDRNGDRWEPREVLTGAPWLAEWPGDFKVFGDELFVSNSHWPSHANPDTGIAQFVFRRQNGGWKLAQTLPAPVGFARGTTAAFGDRLVLGDFNAMSGASEAGRIIIYDRTPQGWVETGRAYAPQPTWQGRFGNPLVADGDRLLVGSSGDERVGAVHVIEPFGSGDTHGLHRRGLTAVDATGHETFDEVTYRVDRVAPGVELTAGIRGSWTLPQTMSLSISISSSDDDGVEGDVVSERLTLEGCTVLDGATYGDGDGLLSDESVTIAPGVLCVAARQCGLTGLTNPTLAVEATDCGGNVGRASRTLPLRGFCP